MMHRVVKLALYVGALLLINAVTWWVLSRNLDAGLYPMDVDSIGLPLMGSIFMSVLVLPAVLILALFRVSDIWGWSGARRWRRYLVRGVYIWALLWALLYTALGFGSWFFVNHGDIALSYLIFVLMLGGYIWVEIRHYRAGSGRVAMAGDNQYGI